MRAALVIILVFTTKAFAYQPCASDLSVELTNRTYNGVKYSDGEYYVDNQTGIERGCVCLKEICARKCCPFGQAYEEPTRKCVNTSLEFNPPVWDDYDVVKGFDWSKKFRFVEGKMDCSEGLFRIAVYPSVDEYHLKTDGTLYVGVQVPGSPIPWLILGPDKYCVDTFIMDVDQGAANHILNALICYAGEYEENHYALSSSCMLLSCFFILLTVGVYAWLPELRNLHGMVLMAYLLSFFVGFLNMATMQILILVEQQTTTSCLVMTFIIYYSILVAFFWLNVMCYDIWFTFSGKRGQSAMTSIRSRFLMYSAYSFGVPSLLTALLAGLEFGNLPRRTPLLPRIRQMGCFLNGRSKLVYLYGPLTILCIVNLVFFVLTAVKIAKIKRQTEQILKSSDSSTHDQHKNDKQRLSLYIKLFVVMGFSWILEVISALYPEAEKFWQITDAYNVLIGVFIFIIFVCKKKTLAMLKKRVKDFIRGSSTDQDKKVNDKNISRLRYGQEMGGSLDTVKTTKEDKNANSDETHL